jgi:hypothetical protein
VVDGIKDDVIEIKVKGGKAGAKGPIVVFHDAITYGVLDQAYVLGTKYLHYENFSLTQIFPINLMTHLHTCLIDPSYLIENMKLNIIRNPALYCETLKEN